jgi:putative transposase
MAIESRKKPSNALIHPSDRGIQYCSADYISSLDNNNIDISMTQTGSPYENALAERVNGIIKNEFFSLRVYQNYKDAKKAIGKIVSIYNYKRPHSSLDFLTPNTVHDCSGPIKHRWKTYPRKKKSNPEREID